MGQHGPYSGGCCCALLLKESLSLHLVAMELATGEALSGCDKGNLELTLVGDLVHLDPARLPTISVLATRQSQWSVLLYLHCCTGRGAGD